MWENIPDNITLEQKSRHSTHVNIVDLANLCQLQGTRSTGEQKTNNDKDGIVENGNGHEFGNDGEQRSHDESGQEHSADQTGNQQVPLLLLGLGGALGLIFDGQSVACKVSSQNDQDKRDGDTAGLGDGTGDGVFDKGSFLEEELL